MADSGSATSTKYISSEAKKAIADMGYEIDDTMAAKIEEWWGWYLAENSWYSFTQRVNDRSKTITRASLHPARRVCNQWASAIMDDDSVKFSVDEPDVPTPQPAGPEPAREQDTEPEPERTGGAVPSDVAEDGVEDVSSESDLTATADSTPTDELMDWVADTSFIPNAQRCLERAFATGTGALALWFDVKGDNDVSIRVRRYDARMIFPLSWDEEEVTECAFVIKTHEHGKSYEQLQLHVLRDEDGDATDTYHIITRVFDSDGRPVDDETILSDFDTTSDRPTFVILRPAIDNAYSDGTALGQSVYADALDVLKAVDETFDSMQHEVRVTKARLFLSDEMFDVDGDGKPIPLDDADLIRMTHGSGSSDFFQVFAPDIRVDAISKALDIALAQLGDATGFGQNYFRYDKSGTIKTAKEVTSDNAVFTRSLKKHENYLKPQLESLLGCVVDCSKRLNGGTVDEPTSVHVEFDDAIIEDTNTEKTMFMSEIAAGVAPAWEYRKTFRGETEDEARRMVDDAQGVEYDTEADLALDAG